MTYQVNLFNDVFDGRNENLLHVGSFDNIDIVTPCDDNIGNRAEIASIDAQIVPESDPDHAVGQLRAAYSNGRFRYRVDWWGRRADVQELGWVFELPRGVDRFSWDRKALWSYYPPDHIGRLGSH